MNSPTMLRVDNDWHILTGAPIYVYSSYWRNWSRRVMVKVSYPFADAPDLSLTSWMEVSLEPIGSRSWDEIATMRLRLHGTSRSRNDLVTRDLPDRVRSCMEAHLPKELVEFMLTGDIYGAIDFPKFYEAERQNYGGGGLPIDLCRKVTATTGDLAGE